MNRATLLLLLLAGCERPIDTVSATVQANAMEAVRRDNDLDSRTVLQAEKIADLEKRVAYLESLSNSLSDQVAHNAKVANENALKDMTKAGACGTEYVPAGNGGYVLANKQCTVKDMKK